jgi:hypothetical protein
MLIMIMVGAAAGVMLSTQQDLSVAGQDRESLQAFYAAEYAVAQGKDYLANQGVLAFTSSWNPLLTSSDLHLCTGGPTGSNPTAPGRNPATNNPWVEFEAGTTATTMLQPFTVAGTASGGAKVQWRWCVHNDPDDPAYLNGATWSVSGNTDDSHDPSGFIVIEGYGQVIPIGPTTPVPVSSGHVWVTVGKPVGSNSTPQNCYSQEGGCGSHSSNGGALEQNITVLTSTSTTRGL